MPFIQNVSMRDIELGHHIDAGPHSMLIQIVDPDMDFPRPFHSFGKIHQFKFLDIEQTGFTNLGDGTWTDLSEFCCKPEQAQEIVSLLQRALAKRRTVICHCWAGCCRSGAVAEVGVMMGFQDTEDYRSPNLLVKKLMMQALGWSTD